MAAPTLIYGGLNLNDHITYFLLPDWDPGQREKTFDEVRGFGGAVLQLNVSEAALIKMIFPLLIKAASDPALRTAVDAINDRIDDGAQDCALDSGSGLVVYHCVHSPRVNYVRDNRAIVLFRAYVTLTLNRTP